MKLGGKKKPKKVGQLRQGQFLSTFGCGAIVDLPGESVIMAGIDFWENHEEDRFRLPEENLQQFLGVDYFVRPPASLTDTGKPTGYSIPAFRFPNWMYCPDCKRLAPAIKFGFSDKPRCVKCNKRLVPSRFVVACENGHLDDFPYEWWVHGGKCSRKGALELFIEISGEKSTLDSIIIKCKSCEKKCKRSMAGSFSSDALKGLKCRGNRPWLRDREAGECDKPLRTMQRGATNLHFAITASALSIPPWSYQVQIILGKYWNTLKHLVNDRETFERVVTAPDINLAQKTGCTLAELWRQAMRKLEAEDCGRQKSWQEILEGEYRAFLRGCSDEKGEFKTRSVPAPDLVRNYVDQVVLALRLREVMALRGFKRINPDYDIDDCSTFNPLSRDPVNWLPAIELKGEGIFVKINSEKLAEWEQRPGVIRRYQHLKSFTHHSMIKGSGFSPRYVLLHTLAHLLIRQLIIKCGYSSASIKERIYSTFVAEQNALDMSGILIYTAANDSEGSLGGLVREGDPVRLDETFRQMMEAASWCSADPLCIQASRQGLDGLNLAACHACTLLPETSCEARNCYLDRAALVGTLDDRTIGFFSPLLE